MLKNKKGIRFFLVPMYEDIGLGQKSVDPIYQNQIFVLL